MTSQTLNPETLAARLASELNENPAARRILLRTLLTDDFLLLPSKVDSLMDLPAKVEGLSIRVDYLEQDVSDLKAGQVRIEGRLDRVESGQARMEGRLDRVEDRLERMEGRQDRMQGQLGNLMGRNYEHRITRYIVNTAYRDFKMRDVRILQGEYSSAHANELPSKIADSEERQLITAEQGYDLERADLIIAGVSRADRTPAYAVIEISVTIDSHDISRAADRANTLSAVTGERVVPAVIGDSISHHDRRLAQDSGVTLVIIRE